MAAYSNFIKVYFMVGPPIEMMAYLDDKGVTELKDGRPSRLHPWHMINTIRYMEPEKFEVVREA